MEVIKTSNVALRFLLELGILAALGYWGFQAGKSLLSSIGLGIGLPVLAALLWGALGAPGSPWQLHDPWHLVPGVVFALVFALNRVLMYAWGQ